MTTPNAESLRIVFAGLANSGKSSLMNNVFEREISIVSEIRGTTTDPVTKKMELAQAGPVIVVDTAGIDDESELGRERVRRALAEAGTADLIVLVTPLNREITGFESDFVQRFNRKNIPLVCAATFSDQPAAENKNTFLSKMPHVRVDNTSRSGISEFRSLLAKSAAQAPREITPLEGIVKEGDTIVLVVPVDLAAPKGRLILPQVETIRDALDRDVTALVVKERELFAAYHNLRNPPALVITDSQAFSKAAADIDPEQNLTSFSILFARKKGDLGRYLSGTRALDTLGAGARVLVFESCAHHRAPDDIGTVKIPRLFRQIVASDATFDFAHGVSAEIDYSKYDIAIMCGGCMQSRRQMLAHMDMFEERKLPVTNYGLFLAWANGLLPRAIRIFPDEYALWNERS